MATVPFALNDGTTFYVEVDRAEVAGPQPVGRLEDKLRSFESALQPVARMAGSIVSTLKQALPDPDELEVCFGLKASLEIDGFIIGKAETEGNYSIKVTWKAGK